MRKGLRTAAIFAAIVLTVGASDALAVNATSKPAQAFNPAEAQAAAKQKWSGGLQKELSAWKTMSKPEKLKTANAAQEENIKRMKESWTKMSDDNKIMQRERILKMQAKTLGLD